MTSFCRAAATALVVSLVRLPSCGVADTGLTTVRVASGLSRPVFVTAPPGDTQRLFIVEAQVGSSGRIRILNLGTGSLNSTPFLTISNVATGDEQGLLGLAFHPQYAQNGYFYVNYTDSSGTTIVRRFTASANPDVADTTSGMQVLSIAQPASNHNGGWLGFGPDGYLYIGMGDGGGSGDPDGNGQNINVLLGKMLRIDVNGDDFPGDATRNYAIPPDNPFVGVAGADEVWAYGLRNPWRPSFDRATGDLYIADVGQSAWEEVDFQPAGSAGGQNYGWRCYEGSHEYDTTDCAPASTMIFPIYEYSHASGCAVTGGYVYRGSQICDLRGTYFFADYCSARIWSFRYDGATLTGFQERTAELAPGGGLTINSISSFGEDAAGELYIVDLGGDVYKIVPRGPAKADMNKDGVVNFDDINPFVIALVDAATYAAQYGVPATQAGDLNCDGYCNFDDINPFVLRLVSP